MDKLKRLKTARHEAGHVLLALQVSGVTFREVTIAPVKKTLTTTRYRTDQGSVLGLGGTAGNYQWAEIYTAGVGGERINRKKPGTFMLADFLSGSGSDYQAAYEEMERVHDTEKEIEREITRRLRIAWNTL